MAFWRRRKKPSTPSSGNVDSTSPGPKSVRVELSVEDLKELYKQLVDLVLHNGDPATMKRQIDDLSLAPDEEASYLIAEAVNVYPHSFGWNAGVPGVSFIAMHDWKAGIEDLNGTIDSALGGREIPGLPTVVDHEDGAAISWDGVLDSYAAALLGSGVVMRMLDRDSNDYQLVYHDVATTADVEAILASLGARSFTFDVGSGQWVAVE